MNLSILEPQLREHINELLEKGYTYGELLSLINRPNWNESSIYTKEIFNFKTARFTITQLIDTAELITGKVDFPDELRKRIVRLIEQEAKAGAA